MILFFWATAILRDNDITIVFALNRIAAIIAAFSLEMFDATYTLGACLLLCEVSPKIYKGPFSFLRGCWNFLNCH